MSHDVRHRPRGSVQPQTERTGKVGFTLPYQILRPTDNKRVGPPQLSESSSPVPLCTTRTKVVTFYACSCRHHFTCDRFPFPKRCNDHTIPMGTHERCYKVSKAVQVNQLGIAFVLKVRVGLLSISTMAATFLGSKLVELLSRRAYTTVRKWQVAVATISHFSQLISNL